MSWPTWPTTGVAPPTVVQGPVINSAPTVANPAAAGTSASAQYTPDQWTQMQHNWQQWAQWQQQFQQWQQQYGAEYQKSMTAMAQARTAPVQQAVPYYSMVTPTQPPLPIETKPPPPPDDSHGSQVQSSTTVQPQITQQHLQQQYQQQQLMHQPQAQPPLPQTTPTAAPLYTPNQFTQPPPMLPSNFTTAPPPPQTAPPNHFTQNPPPGPPPKPQSGYDHNTADDNKFVRNQNFPPNQNWQAQGNRAQTNKGEFGVKRPFNQQYNERGDMKRNRFENQPEGNKWQGGNPRNQRWNDAGGNQRNQKWGETPQPEQQGQNYDESNNQRNQRWGESTNQADNRQQFKPIQSSVKVNPDEPSEAEKKFDKQFAEWEAQFQKWKTQNANHPDKSQYQEYEKKWVTWRAQLLERREQMRRKRLGLTGDASKTSTTKFSSEAKPEQHPTSVEHRPVQQSFANDEDTSYTQVDPQTITAPPTGNQNLDSSQDIATVETAENKQLLISDTESVVTLTTKNEIKPNVEETPHTDESSRGFLKSTTGEGIPGLDLVKEGEDKTEDFLESSVVEQQKKPDLDAISRGINSILGDQNLMNMLSMVSQAQPNQATVTNTQNTTAPTVTKSPKFSPAEYSGNIENDEVSNQYNIDEQSQSSFNVANEPENFNRLNEGENASFNCRSFSAEADDRSLEVSGTADQVRGSTDLDNFNKGFNDFNRGSEDFFNKSGPSNNKAFDSFNKGPDNLSYSSTDHDQEADNFNSGLDNFNQDRNFNQGTDRFNRGLDNFNRGPGTFNRGTDNFNRGIDNFNKGPENFNRGPGNFNKGPGNLNRGPDNFNRGQDNFNRGFDKPGGKFNTFSKGPPSLLDMDFNKGSSGNFNKGSNNFNQGPGSFGKTSGNFQRTPDALNRDSEFDRGWESDNSRRSGDEFSSGNFRGRGGINKRGGGSFGRGGSNNFNRGIQDRRGFDINRAGNDYREEVDENFQRGGDFPKGNQDNFARGGFGNLDRNVDNFNRGNSDNFNRSGEGVNREQPDSFQKDNFSKAPEPFEQEPNNSHIEPQNFRMLANDFDRGPESFNQLGARELPNFHTNTTNEGVHTEPLLGFEPPNPWSKSSETIPDVLAPAITKDEEEGIWKPKNVIDYEHKSLKSAEPDILLVPINMFDYRHKLLSRIPFPQRPKWLSDMTKIYPEFDIPVGRQFDPQQSKRYSSKDRDRDLLEDLDRKFNDRKVLDDRDKKFFEDRDRKSYSERDRKFSDRDRRSFDDRDRKSFDDRDRKLYDDRKSFDERDRKSFDERDRKSFDERNRKSYNDRDRKFSDDRDRKSFDDRDRKGFDERDRKSFDDRDRKSLDDRDRKSFDDRDRKGFDDRDRKSFDDRDRKSFDDRDRKSFDDRDRKGFNDRDRKHMEDRDRKYNSGERKEHEKDFEDRDRKHFDDYDRRPLGNRDQDCDEANTFDNKSRDEKVDNNCGIEPKKNPTDKQEEPEALFKAKFDCFEVKKPEKPASGKTNVTLIEDLLCSPGRFNRPPRIVIILRGPPGSGKSHLAKIIKDKEVENGGSTPRIICLDDYFMVEQDKEVLEDGKKVKVKEMVYEYEQCMEASYRQSLMKSFKKTVTDGYFSFIIVDNVNDKVKFFGEMWSFAKQNGFQVYICEMGLDVQACTKRNIHGRSEIEIERCVAGWEPTPLHHPIVDASSLVETDDSITEVEMEEINSPQSIVNVQEHISSKWDSFDYSVDNLAKLDGISKPLRASKTMEDFLQLDEWTEPVQTKPGQKRVRWADLEEHKKQEKMRAIGFVVGHTNWDRMMDPTKGSSALTQTKYIERYK